VEIEEAKRRARQGPLLLLARRAFAVLIGLGSTITIAHLVSPRDFGLANMSAVILSFAQVFRDFGLTNAVLRKGKISQSEMSFIFWFNAAMTVALSILIAIISPFAGSFYGEPVVKWVILLSVIGFLFGGLSLQHRSLMNRELRFGEMAMIDSISLLTGFVTTLLLAAIYHNVWAIVIGTVVQSASASVLYVARSRWRPNRPRLDEDFRDLLKFGANSSVFSIAVFFSGNAAPIIIGHVLGSSMLGQFNRAQALFTLPTVNVIQPITQATMPLLTRLRGAPDEYRSAYLGLVRRICTILMPASVLITFGAVPLIHIILGERWHVAGLVLSALAPSLAAVGLGYSIGDLFVTQDRSAELRTLGLVEMVLRLGCIAFAVQFGLIPAAIGFSISTTAVALMRLLVAGRRGPVTSIDQFRAAAPGVPVALGAAIGIGLASLILQRLMASELSQLMLLMTLGSIGAVLVGVAVPASRRSLLDVCYAFGLPQIARKLVGKRPARETETPILPPRQGVGSLLTSVTRGVALGAGTDSVTAPEVQSDATGAPQAPYEAAQASAGTCTIPDRPYQMYYVSGDEPIMAENDLTAPGSRTVPSCPWCGPRTILTVRHDGLGSAALSCTACGCRGPTAEVGSDFAAAEERAIQLWTVRVATLPAVSPTVLERIRTSASLARVVAQRDGTDIFAEVRIADLQEIIKAVTGD
jgi:PST family polysaccharide transporter